jgi:hypothetical protein
VKRFTVEPLSAHPSFEHQQKLAKRLLRDVWAGDADAIATWWYRTDRVRMMLELGFDPHVTGTHRSRPLDRASFHGYADIVATLLALDPHPPLTQQNEFGVTPLGTCIKSKATSPGVKHNAKDNCPAHRPIPGSCDIHDTRALGRICPTRGCRYHGCVRGV